MFVAAGKNHVVAYENISHLTAPMQNALAILSTGGGFAKRQLFTDADEHVINVRRPWLVNGISLWQFDGADGGWAQCPRKRTQRR